MFSKWRVVLSILCISLLLGAAMPALAQESVQVRTIDNLRLRAAPSTASQILAVAPYNTVVEAIAISPTARWVRVRYAGMEGWMSRAWLALVQGRYSYLPVSVESTPPAVIRGTVPLEAVIVAPIIDLNMRMEASVEADIITHIPAGRQASAITVSADGLWVLVKYGNLRGWVFGRYLNVVSGSMETYGLQPEISFEATTTSVSPGQCVTLSWNVKNGAIVYFKGRGVNSRGSSQECPTTTTQYTLRVLGYDNRMVERQITVTVNTLQNILFTADRVFINPGECVNVNWSAVGAKEVYYQGSGVPGTGARQECPGVTTTYVLRVVAFDGQSFERQLIITVAGTGTGTGTGTGVNISFTANPSTIASGQCTTISWNVSGIKEVYYQNQGVTGSGSVQECPTTTTSYNLRVITLDNQTINRQVTVTVGTGLGYTISFTANPAIIAVGQCTTVSWTVGGVSAIYYQNQGVTGSESRQECPSVTTTYNLRVITLDNQTVNHYVTVTVN